MDKPSLEEIQHAGVKGMKWGRRQSKQSSKTNKSKKKKSKIRLTDKQRQTLNRDLRSISYSLRYGYDGQKLAKSLDNLEDTIKRK